MITSLFRMLIQNLPFPVWIKDKDDKYVYVNMAYLTLHDKTSDEIIGLKSDEIYQTKMSTRFKEHCDEVLQNKATMAFESVIYDRYSKCFIIPLVNTDNEVDYLAGVIVDIEDQKNREDELKTQKDILRTIIDAIPEIIFYKDKDSRYIGINKNGEEFYKERGVSSVLGKTDLEFNKDQELAQKFLKEDRQILTSKKPIYGETTFWSPNNGVSYREVIKVPVLNENNEAWGIVGLSLDVTEKKRLEEQLRYLHSTDTLTGLRNRSSFEEKVRELSFPEYHPVGVIMGDVNGLKLVNDTFGHGEGDLLLKKISTVISEVCSSYGTSFRWGGDEFVILVPHADDVICDELAEKIREKCKDSNYEMIQLSISLGTAMKKSVEDSVYDALRDAEDKVYRRKLLEEKSIRSSMMYSLKATLEQKNMETEEHAERLVQYAMEIGQRLKLKTSELDELSLVTRLHDIGKIGINEEILMKPGKLTDYEYEIMKTHSEKGCRIVQASGELYQVANGVLTHHERWDGKGYPLGLAGESIPIYARIVNVIDSFDVMTHDRVYKKAISEADAIEELKRCSGTQFDPNIVAIFIGILEEQSQKAFV